jgi:hypothetical protein
MDGDLDLAVYIQERLRKSTWRDLTDWFRTGPFDRFSEKPTSRASANAQPSIEINTSNRFYFPVGKLCKYSGSKANSE